MKIGELVKVVSGERRGACGEVITLPPGDGKFVTVLVPLEIGGNEGQAFMVEIEHVEFLQGEFDGNAA